MSHERQARQANTGPPFATFHDFSFPSASQSAPQLDLLSTEAVADPGGRANGPAVFIAQTQPSPGDCDECPREQSVSYNTAGADFGSGTDTSTMRDRLRRFIGGLGETSTRKSGNSRAGTTMPPSDPTPRGSLQIPRRLSRKFSWMTNANAAVTEEDVHQTFSMQPSPKFFRRTAGFVRREIRRFSLRQFLLNTFPIIGTIRSYKKSYVNADLAAGVSEGIMSIPMGMSYSLLANMAPQHGLYNSLFFPIVYLIFGTGRQVSEGVSAIEALLCAEAVLKLTGAGASAELINSTTFTLTFFVGLIFMAMRLLGIGVIANFLADPVLSGFSSASAFLIGTSQLKYVFGLDIPKQSLPITWWKIVSSLKQTNWVSFGIAASGIVMLAILKFVNRLRLFRRFPIPGQLVLVVFYTSLAGILKLDQPPRNVRVVGEILKGFPTPVLPSMPESGRELSNVLFEALLLAFMYFVIHISIAKTIANQKQYVVNANQELLALGCCNLFGCSFQCFPNATSLSRTSVVSSIGAHTVMHNVPYVLTVVLTLWAITPLLYYLPYPTLAAIVLFGVVGMVDFREARRLTSVLGPDFLLWLVSFCVTLFFGAMAGILASIALSLLWLLRKSARPSTAILGRLPGTTTYRNVKRFPMALVAPGVRIFRFDATLNFSNADYFESKVKALMIPDETCGQDSAGVRVIVIDGSSINDLDVTSIRMLKRLARFFKTERVTILFANWKGPMRDFLERMRFYDAVLPESCFLSLHDAVLRANAIMAEETTAQIVVNADSPLTMRAGESIVARKKMRQKWGERVLSLLGRSSGPSSRGTSPMMGRREPSSLAAVTEPSTPESEGGDEGTNEGTPKRHVDFDGVTDGPSPQLLRSPSTDSDDDRPRGPGSPGIFLPGPGRRQSQPSSAQVSVRHTTGDADTSPISNLRTPHTRESRGEAKVYGLRDSRRAMSRVTTPGSQRVRLPVDFAASGDSLHDDGHMVYEWDGLSAHTPKIQLVREVTSKGAPRTWGIVCFDDPEADGGNANRAHPSSTTRSFDESNFQ